MVENESFDVAKVRKEIGKNAWRNMLSIGVTIERFTTWSSAGLAAAFVFLLSKPVSLTSVVSTEGAKWSLFCFAGSLLAGVWCKYLGMMIYAQLEALKAIDTVNLGDFNVPKDQHVFESYDDFVQMLCKPMGWPLKSLVRRLLLKPDRRTRSGEEGAVGMMSHQVFCLGVHFGLGTVGLLVLCASVK